MTLTDLQEAEKTIGRSRPMRPREDEKEEKEKQDKEKQEEKKETETKEDDYRSRYRSFEEVRETPRHTFVWLQAATVFQVNACSLGLRGFHSKELKQSTQNVDNPYTSITLLLVSQCNVSIITISEQYFVPLD